MAALQGKDLLIYGDGKTTRSFQFVHDLVNGLMLLMASEYQLPVNIGNPEEYSMQTFADAESAAFVLLTYSLIVVQS